MDDYVIVWDLETVPDLGAVARIHNLPVSETALIKEALGEKFPKHIFRSIVCIGALIARRATIPGPWEIVALGAPHIGERTEAELIAAFVAHGPSCSGGNHPQDWGPFKRSTISTLRVSDDSCAHCPKARRLFLTYRK